MAEAARSLETCVSCARPMATCARLAPCIADVLHWKRSVDRSLALPRPPSPLPPCAVLETAVLSQASGSSYAEFGNTKIMVGVYGPRQSERKAVFSEEGRINCDVKLATFATRQRGIFGQSPCEREYSALLQTSLEAATQLHTFPKAMVDVYCCILEAGGSELAVAVTAAALALADAGVAMYDLVPACSVVRLAPGAVFSLHPALLVQAV